MLESEQSWKRVTVDCKIFRVVDSAQERVSSTLMPSMLHSSTQNGSLPRRNLIDLTGASGRSWHWKHRQCIIEAHPVPARSITLFVFWDTSMIQVPSARDRTASTAMASPLLTRAPQCMSCIRRMAYSLGDAFRLPAGQQIRGKKKMAKVATVKVHLLVNIPGYGKRGNWCVCITLISS